ncbi:MAG: T9SS type A sorting domain-containing protein [Bacteroidia bacterium]
MKRLILQFWVFGLCLNFSAQAQNALNFDGTNDQVNCGTDTAFEVKGTAITIEAWINASAWKSNIYDGSIVIKEDNNGNNGFMFRAGNSGRLGFGYGDGSKVWYEINTGSSVLTLNTWHHVAATYDGAYMRLYVDGVIVDSVGSSYRISNAAATPLTIGYHPAYGRNWQGSIDEVRLWNVVRTKAQLQANKDAEFCGSEAGLRAYYKFDHGSAGVNNSGVNTVSDYSGENNTANLSNFALSGSTSNWVTGAGLTQDSITSFDTIENCTPFYHAPSSTYYSTSGSFTRNVSSYWGCDSVANLEVTILGVSNESITAHSCDSFISPKGNIYRKSGTYYNTLVNHQGCDSVITMHITIGADTSYIETAVCKSYVSPSTKYVYNKAGIYKDTVQSFLGCDSVITINLTVHGEQTGSVDLYTCDSVLSPSGSKWFHYGKVYSDTLATSFNCDSILEVTVLGLQSFDTISPRLCYSFTSPSGKIYTESGNYSDTIVNNALCDSVISVNLIIDEPTYFNTQIEGCRLVESITGNGSFITSGTYRDTLVNSNGCDSIVEMDVSVHHINTNVVVSDYTLASSSATGTYQWLNCNDNMEEVEGETSSTFQNNHRGAWAVEITDNNCLDTSDCYNLAGLSVNDFENGALIKVVPNPSTGEFKVVTNALSDKYTVNIYNATGQKVFSQEYLNWEAPISLNDAKVGLYYIEVIFDGGSTYLKHQVN